MPKGTQIGNVIGYLCRLVFCETKNAKLKTLIHLHLNFLLKNLELSLGEAHLLVGEKLLDDQKVVSLYESERNLWIAIVDGFEIEMQISPSKVKAYSCECDVFLREKMCGHVAAGLLSLRKRLTDKPKSITDSKVQAKTYHKLTVNAILEQVGKDELSAFVRHFARGNRHFSIALKTRFAGIVPMADNREKYQQVVSTVLKSAKNKNGRISAQGARQIFATGVDLLGQATDSLALDHYVDCWSVLQVLVEQIVPVINRTDFETSNFLLFSNDCFNLIKQLSERPLPPAIRIELWKFLMEMATRPIYRGYDLTVPLFKLLLQLADDKSKLQLLLELVDRELRKQNVLSEEYRQQLVANKLSILQKKGFSKAFKMFQKEVLTSPDKVLFTVNTAIEKEMYGLAKELGVKGLEISDHHLYQYRLKAILLDIAVYHGESEQVISWARDCFVATGNVKYLRICRQYFKDDWMAFVEQLEADFQSTSSLNKTEYLANLYGEEKLITKLAALALGQNSIDFLMKYDSNFAPNYLSELYNVYVKLLDQYFSNHLGIKPTQKMLKLFAHLREIGAQRVADKLVVFVRKSHPKRLELALELMSE